MANLYSAMPVSSGIPKPTDTGGYSLPGVPTTPVSPTPVNPPTFQSILDLFKNQGAPTINANVPIAGGANFQAGIDQLAPSTGLRPEIQNALDLIKARGEENKTTNIAQAQALAARRGITGSSTELFGTTEAQRAADKATQDSSSNLLLANAQREQQLQDQRASAYLNRGNTEATLGAQLGINAAQLTNDQMSKLATLTSDEIASLRNMDASNRQLTLEAFLGQQGLDIQRANIGAAADNAKRAANYGLIGSIGSAILPSLLGGGGGGGGLLGGGLSSLFGSSAVGTTGVATGQVVPGLGAVGTGVPAAGGASLASGAIPIAAAGAGAMMLSNYGEKKGGTAGGILANPIGYQLNKVKDAFSGGGNVISNAGKAITKAVPVAAVGKSVTNAIGSVFPF